MKEYFKKHKVLSKINQGDENTFLEMYDFFAPKLFKHVYYRLRSREVAEDLSQQVFYKAWQYIGGADNKIDNVNAFLYRTVNNLIIDYSRRSERSNINIDDLVDGTDDNLMNHPDYDKEIDISLDKDKVRASIAQLKVEQKNLIIWRYFDDLSVSEIASIINKPKNSVYVSMHRALGNLKKITLNI